MKFDPSKVEIGVHSWGKPGDIPKLAGMVPQFDKGQGVDSSDPSVDVWDAPSEDMSMEEKIKARIAKMRSMVTEGAEVDTSYYEPPSGGKDLTTEVEPSNEYGPVAVTPIDAYSPIGKMASGVLSDPKVGILVLKAELDRAWGDEWYEWEPETILQTAEADDISLHRDNMDKIFALKVMQANNSFWSKPRVFCKVCLAMSHRMVDWGLIQQPRLHEVALAVTVANRFIRREEYSDAIAAYVAACAVDDGYLMLPPVLSFASQVFSMKLIETMGDEAVERQERLMDALENESPESLDPDDVLQYMRLIRCEQHIQGELK